MDFNNSNEVISDNEEIKSKNFVLQYATAAAFGGEHNSQFDVSNEDPVPGQHSPLRVQHSPLRGQHSPVRVQHSPVRVQHSPVRVQHSPVRRQHSPVRGPHSPVRGPHSPVRGPHSPVRGPHSPVRGPHSPVRGPHSPVRGPHSPGRGPHSPGRGQHSPGRGQHSPGRGQHSPGRGQHSPGRGQHSPGRGQHSPGRGQHSPGRGQHSPGRGQHSRVRGNRIPQPPDTALFLANLGDPLEVQYFFIWKVVYQVQLLDEQQCPLSVREYARAMLRMEAHMEANECLPITLVRLLFFPHGLDPWFDNFCEDIGKYVYHYRAIGPEMVVFPIFPTYKEEIADFFGMFPQYTHRMGN